MWCDLEAKLLGKTIRVFSLGVRGSGKERINGNAVERENTKMISEK